MAIERTLTLSTGHIPDEILLANPNDLDVGFRCSPHEHGWIVFLPREDDLIQQRVERNRVPGWFLPILVCAKTQRVSFVVFDQDEDPIPALPLYADIDDQGEECSNSG